MESLQTLGWVFFTFAVFLSVTECDYLFAPGYKDKLKDFSLRTDDIKEELTRSGKVVRQKAKELGAAVAGATADGRITAAIKAKLVADPDLSALSVSVDTTNGIVTLSGTVSSYENIGKAMTLALETEGVREVVSTLQVRQTKA
ncbi:MAG: BON domain-containing protein [Verrucomicrobia bacterium]|nr:BON domain-containing protein [Verrucomicrobiota bacterium]